jgi:large subunit ribosomal protein L25
MTNLSVKIRKDLRKKVKKLREKGILPAVLYGPLLKKSQPLELDAKTFKKVYLEKGESSLIDLEIDNKKVPVLIHDVQKDPLTGEIIHVDFYQPDLKKEIEARVPIIFEGEAPAVKELGGTFVRSISEIEVKSLPEKLPREIKVDITRLKTFEDYILVKDLVLPEGVKIFKDPNEIIAYVAHPEKVEEELKKPIEEKVDEVKVVEKPAKEDKELTQ